MILLFFGVLIVKSRQIRKQSTCIKISSRPLLPLLRRDLVLRIVICEIDNFHRPSSEGAMMSWTENVYCWIGLVVSLCQILLLKSINPAARRKWSTMRVLPCHAGVHPCWLLRNKNRTQTRSPCSDHFISGVGGWISGDFFSLAKCCLIFNHFLQQNWLHKCSSTYCVYLLIS